ncbi:hypothetical protein VKT23_016611 [Stygiomarasmius scandens]|uniref:Uncharacterized protein n=1 Tax=Marasmiellus scandens TaxID=2682957 RepID=A0ABR1IUK9_9AGAR
MPEELEQLEEITTKYHINQTQMSKPTDPTNKPADDSSDEDIVGASTKSVAQVASQRVSNAPAALMSTATRLNIPDTATAKKTDASKSAHRCKSNTNKGKEKAGQRRKGDSVRTEEENVLLARAADMKKLKSWFSNRLTKEKANKQRDLEVFVNQLNKQALGRPPRIAIDYKFYESHPDFSKKVSREYQAHFPEASNANPDHLKNHTAIAKALFNAESEEIKDRLKRETEAEHAQAVAKYMEREEKGIFDTSDPELLEQRRVQMAPILQNVLHAFARATDTKMSLVIMGDGDDINAKNKIFTSSVQIGSTPGLNPQRFHEWDPVRFKMLHVKSFAQFFRACVRLGKGLEAEPPSHNVSTQDLELVPAPSIPAPEIDEDESSKPKPRKKGESSNQLSSSKGNKAPKGKKSQKFIQEEEAESSEEDTDKEEGFQNSESDDDSEPEDAQPTLMTTLRLKRGRHIKKDLQAELDQLSIGECCRKMQELSEMGKDDFARANVDVRNRGLMKQAGVTEAMKELQELLLKKKGKKPKPKKKVVLDSVEVPVRRSLRQAAVNHTGQANNNAKENDESGDMDVGEDQNENMDVDDDLFPSIDTPSNLPLPSNATESMCILKALVSALPETLEEGKDGDPISALYREDPWGEEMLTSTSWEAWNSTLDTLLQKGPTETQDDFHN